MSALFTGMSVGK